MVEEEDGDDNNMNLTLILYKQYFQFLLHVE